MMARKRNWAALVGLMWLLSFDVAPLVHMLLHEALEEHHHGHHHEQAHQHDDEEDAPSRSEHGEGSVAHGDLAANVPARAVPEVLEALLAWNACPIPPHDERPADRQPRTTRARAPPKVAA